MRRWMATVFVLLAWSSACSAGGPRAPISSAGWFIPKPLPRGYSVDEISTATDRLSSGLTNTLYAPGGNVDPTGPALLVGFDSEDTAMPFGEEGDCSVPGLGHAAPSGIQAEQCADLHRDRPASGYGSLHHFGDYTTLFWESDLEEDTAYFVVARGLSDREVAHVAGSLRHGHAPSVPSSALPRGWTRVASAPPLPRQTRTAPLRIEVVAAGNHVAEVLAYRLDADAATIDSFVAGLQRASQHAELGFVSVERHIGSATVLVIARAPNADLEAIARSIVPAGTDEWKRFRAAN